MIKTNYKYFSYILNSFKLKDVVGLYGDRNYDQSLFLTSLAVEIAYNNSINIYYFSSDSEIEFKKRVVSLFFEKKQESLDSKNDRFISNLYNETKKDLKNIFFKNVKTNQDIFSYMKQNIDQSDINIIIFDHVDLYIDNFINDGHQFFKAIQGYFENSTIFYSYKTPILGDFTISTNHLLAIRGIGADLRIENLGKRVTGEFPLHQNNIFGLQGSSYVTKEIQCTCGGLKTYGKKATKYACYHMQGCDYLINF